MSGVHQILSRLGISYKRARDYGPDKDYAQKLSRIALEEARENPETTKMSLASLYNRQWQKTRTGTKDPLARQSHRSQETCYGMGALNPNTGDVVYEKLHSRRTAYVLHTDLPHPKAERIYLIQVIVRYTFMPTSTPATDDGVCQTNTPAIGTLQATYAPWRIVAVGASPFCVLAGTCENSSKAVQPLLRYDYYR